VKSLILGITGSVAAYKGAELANLLTKEGWSVHVIMSRGAQKFITPLTFQTLTKNKVYTDMFDETFYEDVRHISLAQKADLALIAPASANIIGKIAAGIADDMLTTVIMAIAKNAGSYLPGHEYGHVRKPHCTGKYQKTFGPGLRVCGTPRGPACLRGFGKRRARGYTNNF